MSLHDSFLKLKFDKRMETWNLNQELVTEKEIKGNLENLQDVSENAEPMVLFPEFSDPIKTEEQALQVPQTQQDQSSNKKEDIAIAYDTQSATVTNQGDPQETHNENTTAKEKPIVNKENITQKPNEDPSNPWW